MEAVLQLHQLGFGQLRLMAYVGPTGYWRHGIMPPSMGLREGRMVPADGDDPFLRGSNSVFFWPLPEVNALDPWMVAIRLISRHRKDLEEGLGNDEPYMAWYRWMLTHIGTDDEIYGFADAFEPPRGYIAASYRGRDDYFIPEPPPRASEPARRTND